MARCHTATRHVRAGGPCWPGPIARPRRCRGSADRSSPPRGSRDRSRAGPRSVPLAIERRNPEADRPHDAAHVGAPARPVLGALRERAQSRCSRALIARGPPAARDPSTALSFCERSRSTSGGRAPSTDGSLHEAACDPRRAAGAPQTEPPTIAASATLPSCVARHGSPRRTGSRPPAGARVIAHFPRGT